MVVTLLRGGRPKRPASGKKRPPTAVAKMLGLGVGQLASQPSQDDRVGVGHGYAGLATVGTRGWLAWVLLTAANELLLGQQPRDFIPDLARQLLQVHQRASSR